MKSYDEDRVQMSIVHWLQLQGFLFTSTGAGLVKNQRTQMMMNRLGYTKGTPDLIVWAKNGTLNIECKRPAGLRWSAKEGKLVRSASAGKQSEDQKKFQRRMETIPGHRYLVASSLEEVIAYIKDNNISPA